MNDIKITSKEICKNIKGSIKGCEDEDSNINYSTIEIITKLNKSLGNLIYQMKDNSIGKDFNGGANNNYF
jgi:hypothetical protein